MSDRESTAVVIGGGIGGLAAAAFLHRAGLSVTVYEQASELKEVGAGLVVAPNAARLLRELDVMDGFLEQAVKLEVGWEFRRWDDGEVLSAENLRDACETRYGEATYTAHRADLLEALRSAVPSGSVRLSTRCTDVIINEDESLVRFADGTSTTADLVVGADGVHSVVRGSVTVPSEPTYSGACAFRALVPADLAPPFARRPAQTLWIGPDHHLVHYPISRGELVNLVAFAPAGEFTVESWSSMASRAELLAEFEGWDQRLVDLISVAGTPGRWALLDRRPLSRWSYRNVTLLGDAAHPMFPFYAQGAAQSIEDAAVLARCVDSTSHDIPAALELYERLRIPRTTRLQEISHARALINHLPDGARQRSRDAQLRAADPLVTNGWIYEYDVNDLGEQLPVSR
jgi:salicylate hydroxylase